MTPRRALRPCAHPGCGQLVREGRCARHERRAHRTDARGRGTAAERGYDAAWRRVRRVKLSRDPVCERCAAAGRTVAADLVHHRVPVRDDPTLRLVLGNLESLCNRCHALEHAAEGR